MVNQLEKTSGLNYPIIDPNKFHYLVCGCIEFDCGRTDVNMDGHFYQVY